jgi:hypothetical protein
MGKRVQKKSSPIAFFWCEPLREKNAHDSDRNNKPSWSCCEDTSLLVMVSHVHTQLRSHRGSEKTCHQFRRSSLVPLRVTLKVFPLCWGKDVWHVSFFSYSLLMLYKQIQVLSLTRMSKVTWRDLPWESYLERPTMRELPGETYHTTMREFPGGFPSFTFTAKCLASPQRHASQRKEKPQLCHLKLA